MLQACSPCTVLVLGARGRLGHACVRAFAQAGWRVLAHVRKGSSLVRHQPATPLGVGEVRWIDALWQDEAAWSEVLATQGAVHVVVNAMATAFSTRAWESEMEALTEAGIAVARSTRALLLAPLSIVGYGKQVPEVLYEDDSLPAIDALETRVGVVRARTEAQLHQAALEGVSICTLRAGTYYGHVGDGWLSGAVAKNLPRGRMAWLGPYTVSTPWLYVYDLAQAMERVASQRHRLDGWTRLHFAGQQRTGQQWWQALGQVAEQRGWLEHAGDLQQGAVPWALWKPLGWLSPRIRALGEMEYVWRTPHRLDNSRLLTLIGTEPRTDWLHSVAQTVELLFPSPQRDDLVGERAALAKVPQTAAPTESQRRV